MDAKRLTLLALLALATPSRLLRAEGPAALRLAGALAGEGDHAGASIELRRCALFADSDAARAAYLTGAAHQALLGDAPDLALRLLDAAEDADGAVEVPGLLLRAESAEAARRYTEAAFYLEAAAPSLDDPPLADFARRGLVAAHLGAGDLAAAARVAADPDFNAAARAAVDAYCAGRNKNPRVGGWLGVVPGMGYAYAGEYANAMRSALLNGLFLFAMAESADDGEWGAFAIATFFEITWYTGSIYGGIDATHRHNRARLEGALHAVRGDASLDIPIEALPALRLQVAF